MNIGLYDVDSKIPNLALMKISTWHKNQGDSVEMYNPLWLESYDKIYASTVFRYSNKSNIIPARMEIGGSGWSVEKQLPIEVENMVCDYSLYGYPHSIGFTSRGCRFRCGFCVVPKKEGHIYSVDTIKDIWTNKSSDFIVLLDNDFFGNPEWRKRITEIRDYDLRVNFSQGLNIRVITDEQAKALAKVRFRTLGDKNKRIHFAWDRIQDERQIMDGLGRCFDAGIKPHSITFYVLIGFNTTHAENLYRINELKDRGVTPFVMPFDHEDSYQKSFTRYVNKYIYKTVSWEDYKYK